jgi:hypothetical protein
VPEPFVLAPAVLPPLSGWEQSIRATALRAGPVDDAPRFTELPAGEYLKSWNNAAIGRSRRMRVMAMAARRAPPGCA